MKPEWIPAPRVVLARRAAVTRLAKFAMCALLVLAPPAPARAAGARLAGRVVDAATQKPIANADVELANTNGGQGFHRTRTKKDGSFAIDDVSSDRWYTLTAGADGYTDFVLGGWQIPSAQRAAELVIPLDRAGVLLVKATRSDGRAPVANASVKLQSERGASWWEGFRPPPAPRFTDASGVARFDGLAAGFWTAIVDAPGLRTAEVRRIAVRRGETTNAPVRLVKPASVAGAVRLPDGSGVAGVTITARGPSEQVVTTDPDGAFTLSELPPGKYRLEVSHEAFQPLTLRDPVTLREGDARAIAPVMITPRPAEFAFVLDREAFVPDVAPRVGLRSFRTGPIDLSLYVIPTALVLDASQDFRRFATSGDTTGLTSPERWQYAPAPGPEWAWREEMLTLPHALPAGAYLLRGRAGGVERRAVFFVTDLGLIVKRSASQVWVSAASLRTGAPAASAQVYVIDRPVPLPQRPAPPRAGRGEGADEAPPPGATGWSTALAEARRGPVTTDTDGAAALANTGLGPRLRVVAVSAAQGIAVVDAPIAPAAEQGGDQAFVYTDRPIYRPGHVVHWKLFARRLGADGRWAMPAAAAANVTLVGPDGSTIASDAASLSARGSADGSLTLPKDLALGDWTLRASVGSARSSATLAVQEYRKPEFRVDVAPDRAVYVNGDEVRFRIAAEYFFGAPVFGATVRYNLFETRLAPTSGDADDADEDFDTAPAAGYGRVLKTGETRTDADGRAELSFVPERVTYDRRLTLEVEVTDPASRVVTGRGDAIMGRGLFTLAVRPVAYVVPVGRPLPVEVTARDHEGKPVVAAVTLELDQEAWNPIERRTVRSTRPLASATVTTDSLGRGRANLNPSGVRGGRLVVRARAEDAKGNRIVNEAYAWAFDAALASYPYRYEALEAFADRARYAPGDTAKILVNTDQRDATVLVTVEGRDLLDRRVVRLRGNSGLVTVPLRAEWAPNVFVLVHVRKGMEVHSRTVEIPIEGERHDLAIALEPDRATARPGDSTIVRVRTSDGRGRAVPAEVSLGVVDEALYSLRPDATPDPHAVFYGKRPNWVTTVVSFPALYYGGASKGEREEARRDFKDVAYWNPTILTGDDGTASVGFRYPDNLTTWRLTARGATGDTRVGKSVAKTLVTKDLVARLATPRFMVAGDDAKLVSVVTNRTGSAITDLRQTLAARGLEIRSPKPAEAKAQIAPRGEARAEWDVVAPEKLSSAGAAALTLRATAKSDADALELPVPLRARAVALAPAGAGVAQGSGTTVNVALPQDLVRAGSAVTFDLAPSPAAAAAVAVQELIGFPYGCTEQTADAILPALALLGAMKQAGVTAPGWEDPAAKLEPTLRHLIALQQADGGWGWWQEGDSDPYLTALALDALARATLAGVAPSGTDDALNRATGALGRVFAEARSADGEAYVFAHLAALTKLENAAQRFGGVRDRLDEIGLTLRTSPDALGNGGLALAARGHAELGMNAEAAKLVDLLLARADAGSKAGGLHWTSDTGAETPWWGEDVSNTAYALQGLVAARPQDARATDALQWLLRRRTGPWWRNTLASAAAAQALADYVAAHAGELKGKGTLRASWDGKPVAERAIGAPEMFGAPLRVTVDGDALLPGTNRLAIAQDGGLTTYWSWSARAMVPSPGPPSKDASLTMTREYLRAERTTDRRGRPGYLTTPLAAGEPFHVGETVLVRLTLTAKDALNYVLVEDPRVSGCEIEALTPDGAEQPYGLHAEERDDRAAFFVQRLDQGDTVIEYLIRPEIAGSFTALPANARGMYETERAARSGEARIGVVEEK